MFVYRGHSSPVSTVRYSSSGRYLLSASDYGERKILMWDAAMPLIEAPLQLPHMLFWTPDGSIKRICMRKLYPETYFWLSSSQFASLEEERVIEMWDGEQAADEYFSSDSDTDSDKSSDDSESEEEEPEPEDPQKDDVHESEGIALAPIVLDKDGKQNNAVEYMPNGQLVITVQTVLKPVAELFVSVRQQDSQFDMFDVKSGTRLGLFRPTYPLPWRMDLATIDPLGYKAPKRDDIQKGVSESAGGLGFTYKETIELDENGEPLFGPKEWQVVWDCPGPDQGTCTIVATVRLREETKWHSLSYTMIESPMRLTKKSDNSSLDEPGDSGESDARYMFDQENRHETFWEFVRDKDWRGMRSLLDKNQAVMYYENIVVKRRKKVVEFLKRMFEHNHGLVLAAPFVYRPGNTRGRYSLPNSFPLASTRDRH